MAEVGNAAATTLVSLLSSETGINNALTTISIREATDLPEVGTAQIFLQNVPSEVAEKSQMFPYPAFYVYCDRLRNLLREKFRRFSGTARLNVEVRASRTSPDELDRHLQFYIDAVTDVLHQSRGDWGQGITYSGGYEVQFGPVKQGSRGYLQIAKVILEVDVSKD